MTGLGNPGLEYAGTRHNIGFMVLDRIAREQGLRFEPFGRLVWIAELRIDRIEALLLKPVTYMNRSGRAVGDFVGRLGLELEDVLIVSDDFQLPLGKLRFRARGSSGGHNGLASIANVLGSEEFPRLRCGIGGPVPGDATSDYVLAPFLQEQRQEAERSVARASEAVQLWMATGDLQLCMNRYN